MTISPQQLRDMLVDGQEIALLDVREEAEFGAGHILLAVNVPLSRLELRIANLVPYQGTRVVVCDGEGDGPATRAAARLAHHGYRNVHELRGGTRAWEQAGYQVFSGMNVPSKLFGEFIEHQCHTPSISAEELRARLDAGEDLVVLDSRPLSEYAVMNIPGSVCVPGGELVYRVRELAPSRDTTVVVNCAGRTRSIIGAQSLINAGIGNPVLALRNGTMGWHLAGLELERGQSRYLPDVSAATAEEAQRLSTAVGARFGVRSIDLAGLRSLQQGAGRSLYLLDVRSPEEYEAGHVPGSVSAPGGQLVQATDRYVATLRARLVLIDDDGVRATMAASWLEQLGLHEVLVLERGIPDSTLVRGPQPLNAVGADALRVPAITPASLHERMRQQPVAVLDLQRSLEFRRRHLAGAVHGVRGRLAARVAALTAHELLVLTSDDGTLARFAHEEAVGLVDAPVMVLEGGNRAWAEAGLALVSGDDGLEVEPVDAFLRPYDRDRSVEEAMQSYLDWEIALLERMEQDGTVAFRTV